jgi:hypothetical protein
MADLQHARVNFQNYLFRLCTIWVCDPGIGEGCENTASFSQTWMRYKLCVTAVSHMWYSNKHIEHADSLATVQPSNQFITGRRLVPLRMQMFPYHGSKVKPEQLVTVASLCFQSTQPKISCRVQCDKQYTDKIIHKAVLSLPDNDL